MRKAFIFVTIMAALFAAIPAMAYNTNSNNLVITVKSSGGTFSSMDAALDFWMGETEASSADDTDTTDNDRCIYTGNPANDPTATFNPTAMGTEDRKTKCPTQESEIPDDFKATCDHTDWTLYTGHLVIEGEDGYQDNSMAAPANWAYGFHDDWTSSTSHNPIIEGASPLQSTVYDSARYWLFKETTSGTTLNLGSKDKYIEARELQVGFTRSDNSDNSAGVILFGRSGYDSGHATQGAGGHHYMHNVLALLHIHYEGTTSERRGITFNGTYGDTTSYTRMENVTIGCTTDSYRCAKALYMGTKKAKVANITIGGDWQYGVYHGAYNPDTVTYFRNILLGGDFDTNDVYVGTCTNWPYDYVATTKTDLPCATTNEEFCGTGNELVFLNDGWDWGLDDDDVCATGNGVNLSSSFTDDIENETRSASGAWDIGSDEH